MSSRGGRGADARPGSPVGSGSSEAAHGGAPERSALGSSALPRSALKARARHRDRGSSDARLKLSNPDKVLYPRDRLHQGRADRLLRERRARRCCPTSRTPADVQALSRTGSRASTSTRSARRRTGPSGCRRRTIRSERGRGDRLLPDRGPADADLAREPRDIELHPSALAARATSTRPTSLVFDLDPGAPAGLVECCRWRSSSGSCSRSSGSTLAKTSGSKGLQVYVPLNTDGRPMSRPSRSPTRWPGCSRSDTPSWWSRAWPRRARGQGADRLEPERPAQDDRLRVLAARARAPTVSTPLSWEEVERAARRRRESELSLEPQALLDRIESQGDAFAPLLSLTQRLPEALAVKAAPA